MGPWKAPEGTNTKVTSAKGHFCAYPMGDFRARLPLAVEQEADGRQGALDGALDGALGSHVTSGHATSLLRYTASYRAIMCPFISHHIIPCHTVRARNKQEAQRRSCDTAQEPKTTQTHKPWFTVLFSATCLSCLFRAQALPTLK